MITTNDGSATFYSQKYRETYHSVSGAIEEAFKKFSIPCKIKPGFKILDICFGIGYNSLAAIHLAKEIKIVALENDFEILKKIKTIEVFDYLKKDYEIIKNLVKSKANGNTFFIKNNQIKITLILDDARKTVKNLKERFDAVFLDPFSPKKQPELWTEEFLTYVNKLMKKNSILATYSCAKIVRENLKKAGFIVKDGPVVGRKSPGTIAIIDSI